MNRRDFFKKGAKGAVAASLIPMGANASQNSEYSGTRDEDQWLQLGSGKRIKPDRKKTVQYDVAVLGGGMAGMCAAVAAARNGAKTVLVQDRPVLGGNASSEIRVNMNGVTHQRPDGMAKRETGIVEEMLIHNRFLNPQESYSMWDHVLYDFVTQEPNLEVMMNTQAIKANMTGDRIKSARCWQLTTETEYTIKADQFIDCSGDGMLAATAGALYRTGREAKSEFKEKFAPEKADGWQMGASILLHAKDMGKPTPYTPPSFVREFDAEKTHHHRLKGLEKSFKPGNITSHITGFWWVELGSEFDNIADLEKNRHKLMGYLHGVWDYIKNSGKYPEAENFAIEWVGSFPGRRESRRFIGDHVLRESDLTEYRHFEDAVAYGGWSLDEHNPGGIEDLEEPPSYFHDKFTKIYEIPYRSLYSRNISNLLFAGRNISQTHIALSSSRVMGTCALMGQAAGTAAAICIEKNTSPRGVYQKHLTQLKEQLMRDDAFIPNHPAEDPDNLAKTASVAFASSTKSGDVKLLLDGYSRDALGETHHWKSDGLPAQVQYEWENPIEFSKVEIKCDTNVKRNLMLRRTYTLSEKYTNTVPVEMLKSLEVEARVRGKWVTVGTNSENKRRLIKFAFDPVRATAVRITLRETYGAKHAKLHEVRIYES
ncbi:FAD-dependent oxidoreductase [Pelagicoccus mobilis]|uniref:FAD-dependent oxidoreductase n=1 Tax=Pelagicoccus mobilis TaxID=415221 RepID=A0A934RQQ8_9BACT|nr:FAD-dependent oxidoreductase [Pelagicoccus mobilis]MBK1875800.1 FAD-dependent oxidoreductase [Pelagicoccus mobilis]